MTMYGDAPRGAHTAIKVLVGVAAAVVLVAVVVVWRSVAGDGDPAPGSVARWASPSVAPSITPATETSSAPAELSTGSWLVSLSGGSAAYLTIEDDYAALSSGERTVFAVVRGLSDTSCFSIREPGGKYLRHFDYRLRFDEPDGSDLYREDATFCPLPDVPAGIVRLRSANFPDRLIHSRDNGLYVDERDGSDTFDADSSFTFEGA